MSVSIRKDAKIAVICRGGPVNGPYAASALRTIKHELGGLGLSVSSIYGNSASVPAAVLSAIGQDDLVCDVWGDLRPSDIIVKYGGWWDKGLTIRNLLFRAAIFDDTPLEKLIKGLVPREEVFSEEAIRVKLMSTDYLTGRKMVFDNRNPRHRGNWHNGMLGSMALVPFLKPQIIYDVQDEQILAKPYRQTGWLAQIGVAIDGGYRDNLMFDCACQDGNDVVFVVDINGLEFGPLVTYSWEHWGPTLERAFHLLVTTNDRRRQTGVLRTNETLEIRDGLTQLHSRTDLPDLVKVEIDQIINRMNSGPLKLSDKHKVTVISVADPAGSRPFDFSNFTKDEAMHLLATGEQAAARVFRELSVQVAA